jgi:uncharacterized membrane protein YhaH (DUF805 family)
MSDASAPPSSPSPAGISAVFRLWFGFEAPVSRRAYMLTGLALMVMKYALEVAFIGATLKIFWSPVQFLSPLYSVRYHEVSKAPPWVFAALAIMTLPFMWVGVTMSVRRAVDAGLSAWIGLGFVVPLLNYLLMILLAVVPPKPGAGWQPAATTPYREGTGDQKPLPVHVDSGLKSALFGVAAAVLVGLAMVGVSIYGFGLYGAALFFVTPFVMGAVSGFLYNRPYGRALGPTLGVSFISTLIAGSALMLFALEGLVCLLMALPIAATISLLGAAVGRAIATQTRTSVTQTAAMVLVLPGLAGAEAGTQQAPLHEVLTVIEVDAPPERVWPNVIGFSELDPPTESFFAAGIAYPMRAEIRGTGVGAVRHCVFSTGPFVEPITRWDAPRTLSFDVAEQPPAMKEWSPFRAVHPPHLDQSLRSKRGEFRLIPLEGGRTRLEGSTWYELSMYPEIYWKIWSDGMIHSIHTRVLKHVKRLSEAAPQSP